MPMRVRRTPWLSGLLALSLCTASGCARSHERRRAQNAPDAAGIVEESPQDDELPQGPEAEPDPPSPFGALAVSIQLIDVDADPRAHALSAHPLLAYVEINGGRAEGRVPELHVFQNDSELEEVGSAGSPQQFSYQGGPEQSSDEEPLRLRFALANASTVLSFFPSPIDLESPSEGSELHTHDAFSFSWTGTEQAPYSTSISTEAPARCPVTFSRRARSEHDATYDVHRSGEVADERCAARLTVVWMSSEEDLPETPFESLTVTRRVLRTRSFGLWLTP
jgi:hypothetical protein